MAAKRGIKNGFKPTALQRRVVKSLIASEMSKPDICKSIIHQITGKPITDRMMKTHFKEEMGNRHEGGPKFVPTEEQKKLVQTAAGCGMIHESIAKLIINPRSDEPIGKMTLQRHFKNELSRGLALAEFKVTGRLFQTAMSANHPGATTAGIFIAKTKYGFIEKQHIEHSVGTGVLVAPPEMTPEQFIESANKRNEGKTSPVDD